MAAVHIFCCYEHEDKNYLRKLRIHLNPLEREQIISVWHDQDITAGSQWEEEIKTHLNTAHMILLLISPDFLASDYCYGVEMNRALERHENEEAIVIPIILRSSSWQNSPLQKLQALPPGAKPITDASWSTQDKALVAVTEGIRQVALQLYAASTQSQGKEETLLSQEEDSQKDQETMDEQPLNDNTSSQDTEASAKETPDALQQQNTVVENKAARLKLIRANLASMEETIDIGAISDLDEQFVRELDKTLRQAIAELREIKKDRTTFEKFLLELNIDDLLENLRQARIEVIVTLKAAVSSFSLYLTGSLFDQRLPKDFYQQLSSCREYIEKALDAW